MIGIWNDLKFFTKMSNSKIFWVPAENSEVKHQHKKISNSDNSYSASTENILCRQHAYIVLTMYLQ